MATNGFISPAKQRRVLGWFKSGYSLTGNLLLYGVVFIICVPGLQLYARAQQLAAAESFSQNESGICKSMDIRNTLDTFKRLEGCRVVEGFVQVLLFDNVNETLLSTISFPELTEITDYLLLYRVNGLRSVGQLFPNLTVIRGEHLFLSEYAFVVFEMSRLQEIGLYSLTDITKGSVRIDKNPSLCFVKSIDWSKICHEKVDLLFFDIKPDNECPVCPTSEEKDEDGSIIKPCPKSRNIADNDDSPYDRHLCWNRQHCQKICPDGCLSCNDKMKCCDKLCLGGCSNYDVRDCVACRNYSMGFGNERKCMSDCPYGYYKYSGRCITKEECINTKKPIDSNDEAEYPYKIFNDTCVLKCPNGYTDDVENHSCRPCHGKCVKECPSLNVDSLDVARQLTGCTVIKGSLEIQIRGGVNVVSSLEECLGMIEDIHGYLKIVRSFPLVSLSFLKSLKRIRGDILESSKYVFIVLDNQNLQELWEDWPKRSFKIDQGSLFFHFNPKLCYNKIEMIRNKTNLKPFTELEVARNSNGDKIACNVSELKVNVSKITSKSVILSWKPFELDGDDRQLLGYIVYSIEAPNRNVTLYDGRDACGVDNWRVDDVAKNDEIITHPLHKLKPYTQYAFYVKTYTVASEKNGAESKINYFRTLPAMPSAPRNVMAFSNGSDSLYITWQPPYYPNGNVTYYIVSGKRGNNDHMNNAGRNYCNKGKVADTSESHSTTPVPNIIVSEKPQTNGSCVCNDKNESKKKTTTYDETVGLIERRNKFEDALQNTVYVKREPTPTRRKRQAYDDEDEEEGPSRTLKDYMRRSQEFEREMQFQFDEDDDEAEGSTTTRVKRGNNMNFPSTTENTKQAVHQNQNVTENGTWVSFTFFVYSKTEFYINNLHHFTYYDISVQACREAIENDTEILCSKTSVATKRTLKKPGADDIKSIKVVNTSTDSVAITWDVPKDPNGVINYYYIDYKDYKDDSVISINCIPHKDFKQQNYVYIIRNRYGNYSVTVKAITSAGPGKPSLEFNINLKESTNTGMYFGITSLLLLICIVGVGTIYWKKHIKDREMRLIPTVNPEYMPSKYIPDEWEVPRDTIKLIQELGQGSFGMVYEGEARDIRGKPFMRCAVKTVNEHATNSERMEFLNEASVMKAFDTAHVVRLLGVVSETEPTLVIMEWMANKDLKTYLRSHRPDAENFDPNNRKHPPSLKRIYQMAVEIADGMSYLAAKKFVHRDLAARNCMVAEDLTVKIGDFGMTRDIYETDYYRKGTKGLLPVRWMAPESLRDGVFTSSSDIWSYGVVLWEMATLASQPYQGLANDQVLRFVIDGGVMERPENCPDKLYNLMRLCWRPLPSERPTFLKICSLLLDDASPDFAKVSFYHSAAGIEARSSRPTPSPSQDDQTTPLNEFHDLDSDDDSEHPALNSGNRISFPTANGFGIPTNGAATTQC